MTVLRKSMFVVLTSILAWHVIGIAGGFTAVCFPNIFKRYRIYYPKLVTELPHESAIFRRRSGIPLNAFFFRNPNTSKAILLCHGRSSNKTRELPYARNFMAHYNVLAIDFRSHGSNRSGTTTIGMKESQDVLGALDWLAEQGMTEVAVVGHSMGAAAAIKALSELEPNGPLQVKAQYRRYRGQVSGFREIRHQASSLRPLRETDSLEAVEKEQDSARHSLALL